MRLKISPKQGELLAALAAGAVLKSHRDLDGRKIYRLHALDGQVIEPPAAAVDLLKRHKLIDSNKKFPAATYLLTDNGREIIEYVTNVRVRALTARMFIP